MDGLESITHVGQGTSHDDTHRVVEVGPLHLDLEVDLVDLVDAGLVLLCRLPWFRP